MSLFITFEGGEGSGKSTQARLLAARIAGQRLPVTLVREPGSTPLGQRLRGLVKGMSMSPTAELLLFGAARAELVATVIEPHLARGRIVVADRYVDSTIAYQQYGRGLPADVVSSVNRLASGGRMPDLTFLLDLPPDEGLKRVGRAPRPDDPGHLRFEQEALGFHRRVRAGYQALAKREPARWVAIDALQPREAIEEQVWGEVRSRLRSPMGPSATPDLIDLTDLAAPAA